MMTPATSHVVAGKYRLDRPLARGGMGSVWVAKHLQLDSVVAIKFMEGENLASSAENRARFEREARMAAQLQSPHIVQVHDYGVEDGTPYMVMELLHGEDLRARLRRDRVLTLRDVTHIVQQLSRALRKAHDLGIVHRDLKPANVFLATADGEETVKILDFGIAKAAAGKGVDDATQTGVILGSLRYMSPEQARGFKTLDHRSDLWSLGVIIFRALTGRLPFDGEQSGDVLVKICAEPIPLASALKPSLGPGVDEFFERAFAREPAARFQNAVEMAAALATLLEARDGRASGLSFPGLSELPPPMSEANGTPNSVRGGVTTSRTGDTNGWTPIPGMRSSGKLREPGLSTPVARSLHQRSGVIAAGVMLLVALVASITLAVLHTPAPDELTGGGVAVAQPAVVPTPTTPPAASSPTTSAPVTPTATPSATATTAPSASASATTPPSATATAPPAVTTTPGPTPSAKSSSKPSKPGKPSSELGF